MPRQKLSEERSKLSIVKHLPQTGLAILYILQLLGLVNSAMGKALDFAENNGRWFR